jgi:hypothetical protein
LSTASSKVEYEKIGDYFYISILETDLNKEGKRIRSQVLYQNFGNIVFPKSIKEIGDGPKEHSESYVDINFESCSVE